MGEDELINSLSISLWELRDDMSVSDTWLGFLGEEGNVVELCVSKSCVEVMWWVSISFVSIVGELCEACGPDVLAHVLDTY